jgi:hypothetical protein
MVLVSMLVSQPETTMNKTIKKLVLESSPEFQKFLPQKTKKPAKSRAYSALSSNGF